MSLRNRIILPLALLSLAALAACGGSGNNTINPTPPPSGGFSSSNLNGTYVFSVGGIDSQGAPYALLGTFTANGQGGITGGAVDVNDVLSAPIPNRPCIQQQLPSYGGWKRPGQSEASPTWGTSCLILFCRTVRTDS